LCFFRLFWKIWNELGAARLGAVHLETVGCIALVIWIVDALEHIINVLVGGAVLSGQVGMIHRQATYREKTQEGDNEGDHHTSVCSHGVDQVFPMLVGIQR